MKILGTLAFCLTMLCACTPPAGTDQKPATADQATSTRATVTGTTAQPDPVETRIRALEQAGQLKVLAVRESFPLQFELEGSAQAIAEVQALVKR